MISSNYLSFFSSNAMSSETSLDIIDQTEKLTSLLDCNDI